MLESTSTLTEIESPWAVSPSGDAVHVPVLVIAWSASQPERVGEVAVLPPDGAQRVLGRGPGLNGDPAPRLHFRRERPGESERMGELLGPRLSRRQALVRMTRRAIEFENVGACPMRVSGVATDRAKVSPGDTVTFKDQLVLLCIDRTPTVPSLRYYPTDGLGEFGQADALGIVGESQAAWRLRDEVGFVGRSAGHVLVLGESGVGKEVAARGLHALSDRGRAPIVARSAATFPDTLIDAELFGNVGNFPNPGMRERPGLLGEADGSSLLLDEIGELPAALQSRLLRVLDEGGEYSRLGEATSRRADFRLIAATNRSVDELKPDFAARFTLRLRIVGLNDRRDDIPLLIRHVLARAAANNPDVAQRFYEPGDATWSRPRLAPQLVDALVRHTYRLHMRELEGLLWRAILSSPGDFIGLTDEVRDELSAAAAPVGDEGGAAEVTERAVRDVLERTGGNVSKAARVLGLKNRYVLYRLMARYGIR